MTSAIWTFRNNAIFRNEKVNPGLVINFTGSIFSDMRFYNVIFYLFEQESEITTQCNDIKMSSHQQKWVPPDKEWIKINTDASRRYDLQSITIGYIIKDAEARVVRTSSKKLGDCSILVAECEAAREAMMAAIMMGSLKVCINTDSQIIVNAVKGKVTIPKDILNLVEDIRRLSICFKDFNLDYCDKADNRVADVIVKKAHV